MKLILPIAFLCCISLAVNAQTAANNNVFEIIYVDNFQSSLDAGLTAVMDDTLHHLIQSVEVNKPNFFLMESDNNDPNETHNFATLETVFKDVNNHTHVGSPVNEQNDLKEIRDNVFDKIDKFHPRIINVSYFVSNDVLDWALNSSSFLIDFFPDELAAQSPDANITVTVYYSGSRNKNVKEKLERSFNFYNKAEFKTNVRFKTVSL